MRACCTRRFFGRLTERNNYELGGVELWNTVSTPPKIAALGGSLFRLRPFLATEARLVSGLRCKTGLRLAEGSLNQRLGVGREQPHLFSCVGGVVKNASIRGLRANWKQFETMCRLGGHGVSLCRHLGGRFCSAVGELLPAPRLLVLCQRHRAEGERSTNRGPKVARKVRHSDITAVAGTA